MKSRFDVVGFKELEAALNEFRPVTARNVIKRSLRSAGEIIADEAQRRSPVDTGELKLSIGVSDKLGPRQKALWVKFADVQMFVGPTDDRRYIAHLLEFGTSGSVKGERMGARDTDSKQSRSRGRKSYRTHGGTSPQPFMRPAFDLKKEAAAMELADKLRAEIDKAKTRASKKALKSKR